MWIAVTTNVANGQRFLTEPSYSTWLFFGVSQSLRFLPQWLLALPLRRLLVNNGLQPWRVRFHLPYDKLIVANGNGDAYCGQAVNQWSPLRYLPIYSTFDLLSLRSLLDRRGVVLESYYIGAYMHDA